MLKKILNLESAQEITKTEQKTMEAKIPECWLYAIESGCILIPVGGNCPMDTYTGVCDSTRLCC